MKDSPMISGNPDDNENDRLEAQFVVENTKDFTKEELSYAMSRAAIALHSLVEQSEGDRRKRWELWASGRFGKLLRRAKPTMFARIAAGTEGAVVIDTKPRLVIIPPLRRSEVGKPLSNSQISGLTVLPSTRLYEGDDEAPVSLDVVVNDALGMSPSKGAVAAAHATQGAQSLFLSKEQRAELSPAMSRALSAWRDADYPVHVCWANILEPLVKVSDVVIHDAGLTEVVPGSITAVSSLVFRSR